MLNIIKSTREAIGEIFGAVKEVNATVRGAWDRMMLRGLRGWSEEETSVFALEREPFKRYSWLQIAIHKKAMAFASCEFQVKKGDEVVKEGPVVNLFRDVNPLMSENEFFYALCLFYNLKGEFFVYFPPTVGEGTRYGKVPTEMYVLEPQYMHPAKDKSGEVIGWVYKPATGKTIPIEPENIIHLKRYNPYNQLRGLSPYDALRLGIRIDFKAAIWNEAFFDNNAVPDGFLVYPDEMDETQYKAFKKRWDDKYQGAKKAHQVGLLTGGIEFKQAGITQTEMEFLESRRFSREEVLAAYEVPKALLSITDDLNYATLQGLKKSFWHEVVIPFAKMVKAKFNSGFFAIRVPDLRCNFDWSNIEALQDDEGEKITRAKDLFGMGWPPNEINKKLNLGFEDVPWGDKGYLPINLVPYGKDGAEGGNNGSGKEKKAGDDIAFPESNFPTESLRERVWAIYDMRARLIEKPFERKVKAYFYDQRKMILELLEKGKREVRGDSDVLTFQWDDEIEKFVEVSTPYVEAALESGIEMALELLGDGEFSKIHPEAVEWMEKKIPKLKNVPATVKKQVRDAVVEGIQKGETTAEIASRIREIYNFSSTRARTIVRTETGGAFNAGSEMTLRNNGVKEKEWLTSKDKNVRDSHRNMDGQIVASSAPFMSDHGNAIRYPGDPTAPAKEIINCRCSILPVIKE